MVSALPETVNIRSWNLKKNGPGKITEEDGWHLGVSENQMKTISEWSGWTRGTFGALARPDLVWLETIKKRFGENYK